MARFAGSVPAGAQTAHGSVEVTSSQPIRGVGLPAADAFLVRNGRIATMPVAQDAIGVRWDLAAGETKRLDAAVSLLSCAADRHALAPGRYDLYARVVLTADDGAEEHAFGGPWPLHVR